MRKERKKQNKEVDKKFLGHGGNLEGIFPPFCDFTERKLTSRLGLKKKI